MVIVTIRFTSQVGYLVTYSSFPFSQRLAVSGNALFEYCRLMLYPIGILPFYLIPDPIPVSFTFKTAVFAFGAFICFRVRNNHPWLPAILLLFVLPLVPVLAFFQNGDQAFAARFTYLPSLGLSVGAALLISGLFSKRRPAVRWNLLCSAGVLVVVLLYVAVTVRGIAVWQDSVSLWTRVIDLQPEVASYKERGKLYAERGDYRDAVNDFSSAIGMATGVWQRSVYNLYAFRGEAYRSMGRYSEAVQDFTTAISLYPHPVYYHYRGMALQQLGQSTAASDDFARADGAAGPLDWFERSER
jgi:tetratricopeptide (TPR) repeat protein